MSKSIRKVVLAYSGGLDTSVIVKWLQQEYQCEVITFTADLGQGEELEPARQRAAALGVTNIYCENLQRAFVRDYIFPMFRANALYEGEYLLGTSIARPLIAKRLVDIAQECDAQAIAHGATGKGNDQVRFELGIYALNPKMHVIAPWREWALNSRSALLAFCREHGIDMGNRNVQKPDYSIDANLLHTSYEGGDLENLDNSAPHDMWQRTRSLVDAPNTPSKLTIRFAGGDPVAINGETLSPEALLAKLNAVGGENAIGRIDIVENRHVGIKSRGCYETPGGTILLRAHRAIESITLDGKLAHLKDELMPRYAELIYNGFWFAPERLALQQLIDYSQKHVDGEVELELYKGNITITKRSSPNSLFDAQIATFEDDAGSYNQRDAEGFIRLSALRLRQQAQAGRDLSS